MRADEKPKPLESPVQPPFKYFGGKYYLRKDLVEKMPPHKTYVEPFAGGASVLLDKPPSEKEVLGDKNRNIMKVHSTIKHRKQTWDMSPSRRKWEEIRKKPTSSRTAEEQAYLFDHSFQGDGKNYSSRGKTRPYDTTKPHERFKDVTMVSDDFGATMRRWDSEQTFHYLDPPYVQGGDSYNIHGVTPQRVADVAGKMKGKVMISYDNRREVREAFDKRKFEIHTIQHRYTSAGEGPQAVKELLITNFNPSKERAKAKPFDESEAKKELKAQA